MKNILLSGMTVASLAALLPETALAHGGQYRGPGDVVPPGGGEVPESALLLHVAVRLARPPAARAAPARLLLLARRPAVRPARAPAAPQALPGALARPPAAAACRSATT